MENTQYPERPILINLLEELQETPVMVTICYIPAAETRQRYQRRGIVPAFQAGKNE